MKGTIIVPQHSIGTRSIICQFCNALRFVDESDSVCCLSGKVSLPPLPPPPEPLQDLYTTQDQSGTVFRKYIRQLNNCLSMSSLKAGEGVFSSTGYQPTVFLQVRNYSCF